MYPTSALEVGLTVDPAELELYTGSHTFTTSQTLEGYRFRQSIIVNDGVTLTLTECKPYGPGFWMVNILGALVASRCDFGLWGDDSFPEDPDGWTLAHYAEIGIQLNGGTYELYDSVVHHAEDLLRISTGCLVDHCYLTDLTTDTGAHADAIQCTGGSGWAVRNSNVQAVLSAELAEAGVNAAFMIAPDFEDITGFEISGSRVHSPSIYAIQNRAGTEGEGANTGGVITGNVVSGFTSEWLFDDAEGSATLSGNVDVDNELFPGQGEEGGVPPGDVAQFKVMTDTDGTPATFAFDAAPTVGNLIVIGTAARTTGFGGMQSADITERAGADFNGTIPESKLWAKLYEAADGNAYVFTNFASEEIVLIGAEIEGPVDPINVDQTGANNTGASTTTDHTSASITPTVAASIAFAMLATSEGGVIGVDAGSSDWTLIGQANAGSFRASGGLAVKVLSTMDPEDCAFDISSAQKCATAIINVELPPASGGGNRMGGTGAIRKPPRRSR